MKIIKADAISFKRDYAHLDKSILLESFFKKNTGLDRMIEKHSDLSLFLDSGAYSAFTQNIDIHIDEYIEYIKTNREFISIFAVLDSIGDPEKTLKNQLYMELKGLLPLPCFHYGEDHRYLQYYVEKYKYIALGGMVKKPKNQLRYWLDEIWGIYLVNTDGTAKVKIHGFGMTSVTFMKRYPWYSVDSTSWVLTGRFGTVFCNVGDYNKIIISNKGDITGANHYCQLDKHSQERVQNYFANLGEGYTIEELADDYKKRDEVNILYFLDLEKQLTDNPPRFIQTQTTLF